MIRAYVMLIAAAGTAEELVSRIRQVDGVTEAHVVAGDFDLVAEVSAADTVGLRNLVVGELQSLDGIGTTRTYVVLD